MSDYLLGFSPRLDAGERGRDEGRGAWCRDEIGYLGYVFD